MKFINTWLQCQKNVYIDKLDIINKYNSTYHSAVKMKHVDAKSNTYVDCSNEINEFQNIRIIRISKYKILLQKVTLQIGLKKVL